MVDPKLMPAIRAAIRNNELGNASPYCLSYACLGASGASFGIFQADTNVNHQARATLMQALQTAQAPADAISRIIAAVSQPCPNGNPLSPADTALVASALSSPAGCTIVDQLDDVTLQIVLSELSTCIAAAATRQQSIDPVAQLYIALWVNMTGAPYTLGKWLSGTAEFGLNPPAGPSVTQQHVQGYLQANTYFRLHPRNFVHMQDSVRAALPLVPADPST